MTMYFAVQGRSEGGSWAYDSRAKALKQYGFDVILTLPYNELTPDNASTIASIAIDVYEKEKGYL